MQVVLYVIIQISVARARDGVVPTRPRVHSLFDLNSELHLSLSAAAMSPLEPLPMYSAEDWGDPSKSELSTQPNSGSGD